MAKLLVCQHVPYEPLGTLDPLLGSYGVRIRYVNFGRDPDARPQLRGYHGLVLLGGPMSLVGAEHPAHIETEIALVRDGLARGIPVLGICLGAQIIARALGAEVRPSPRPEIGWSDVSVTAAGAEDPLLRHFAPTEKIFQWHADSFEIPDGAVHLASTPECSNQAFRFEQNIYALQFHLEVDAALIERWLNIPAHRRELESLHGQTHPDRVRRETCAHIGPLMRLGDRVFGQFIQLLGNLRRRPPHPHR